jgi:predicted nucleic acid-binding protein
VARRIVFNTNVLISGYLWKGPPRQAIEKVHDKEWTLLVAKDTLAELIRVLAYDKFSLSPEEIQPIIEDVY